MLIKYKDAAYNNKIEDLRNNGYTVNFVDFDYDDFVMEEGNPVPFIELQLPNGGKSYNDYSAIVAWSNYVENSHDLSTRTYSGMPVPSSFTVQDGDTPVNCYYVIEDTATEGVVRFSRIITSQGPFSNEDFSDFVGNLCGLMFIEGDECTLDPDVSLVVPNLEAIFSQVNATETFQLDLTTKTRLLSLGDDEEVLGPRFYSFTQQPTLIIEDLTDVPAKDCICNNGNCSICHDSIFSCTALKMIGFSSIKDIETLEKSNIDLLRFIAQNNNLVFEKNVTEARPGCLYLRENVIYPIASSLSLKSDIHICGNGSTIMAYAANEDNEENFVGRKNTVIITNKDLTTPISNVSFANLTFKGTYPLCDSNNQPIGDDETGFVGDQCIYTQAEYPLIKNLRFENVNFTGFKFAVHTGKSENTVYNAENCNWKFNNCDFTDVETGFMLSWVQGITVTNCHIDNSIAKDDLHHCMYIARGSSYISVDNCLLENSIGGGIDFGDTTKATDEKKMHHCSFTNLQIRNCRVAVTIGSPSEDIIVKNIHATNVGRALKLGNCKRVTIDNFNATGNFYYEYIRKDADGETRFPNTNGEWGGISVWGYADAKITNSFFSTGGAMFTSQKSELLSDDFDYRVVTANLEFKNCIFVSTFSEYKLGSDRKTYYQPSANLGIRTENVDGLKEFYYYYVNFDDCQFYMNSENNEYSMITLRGFEEHPSIYNFSNCLIAYRDGNGNAYHDKELLYDDEGGIIENQIVSMPKSYFINPDSGSHAKISNCSFYHNREIYPESGADYGFVKFSLLKYCTLENNRYNQRFKVVDEYPVVESEETN